MIDQNKAKEEAAKAAVIGVGTIFIILFSPILLPSVVVGYLYYWFWYSSDEKRFLRFPVGILAIGGMLAAFWKLAFGFFGVQLFKIATWFGARGVTSPLVLEKSTFPYLVFMPLILGFAVTLAIVIAKLSPKEAPYIWIKSSIFSLVKPASWALKFYLQAPKGGIISHLVAGGIAFVIFQIPVVLLSSVSFLTKNHQALNSLSFVYYVMGLYAVFNPKRSDEESNKEYLTANSGSKGISIGKIIKPRKGHLKLTWKDINHHIHILGQPGSGKSVLLRNIYSHQILSGEGMLMIDLKADLEVKSEFKGLVKLSKREKDLIIIDLSHPELSAGYNPLLRGEATQLKDKIMSALDWSEVFYKKVSERFLLHICRGLVVVRDDLKLTPTLADLNACLSNPQALQELATKIQHVSPSIAQDLTELVAELRDKNRSANRELSGLRTDIEVMIKSSFGPILERPDAIDLLEAIKAKKVILVNLDGQTYRDAAIRLGRMLISDLRSASGHLVSQLHKSDRPSFALIIDEFSDIISNESMASDFVGFLNRCRGAGIGVVIAHQSLGDFKEERTRKQILDSTETTISFVQKDPDTCELLANIIGTRETVGITEQTEQFLWWNIKTGKGTERITQEYIFHPNEFKSLSTGFAIYSAKKPTRNFKVEVKEIIVPTFTGEIQSGSIGQENEKQFLNLSEATKDYPGKLRIAVEGGEADI